ncbi:MAG: MBL fold metallo-hydrolase [bacterium]
MLTPVSGNSYYIPGAVNCGVYVREGGQCTVIDTGGDDTSGKIIARTLRANNLTLTTIINTHSHPDHSGGNARLVRDTGAAIYAPEFEAGVIEYPSLEPFYLFSAAPIKELQGKFLQGKPSRVSRVIRPGDNVDGLEVVDLAGHAPGQIGVATPDGVLYTADAYFAVDILEKYFVPYFADIGGTRATLERLAATDYDYYLPCHGQLATEIAAVLAANTERLDRIAAYVLEQLCEPRTKEELLASMVNDFQIALNPVQYYLTAAALSAHLSYLANRGDISFLFGAGRMLWRKN